MDFELMEKPLQINFRSDCTSIPSKNSFNSASQINQTEHKKNIRL